jgi:phosphoribosylamine--glycine ligase
LCVSALGNTIEEAIQLAYEGVDHISWQDMIFRRDIGWRAIDR